jgi:hypothetical protein
MTDETNEPQAGTGGEHVPSAPGEIDQAPVGQPDGTPADAGDAGDDGGADTDWGYSTIREAPAPDDSIRGEPLPDHEVPR